MDLFSPVTVGSLHLRNRIAMAPLTRMRSGTDGVPSELVAEHYAQRAGLGLLITEGTYPSAESRGFPGQPGIVTDEQAAGWAQVARAVHDRGGAVVMQLMNAGRVSHPEVTGTARVVAPSAIAIDGEVHTPTGKAPYPVPHALSTEELSTVTSEFVQAARRAVDAGLDGVELHAANGYLLHQFLSPASNRRTDGYGGSPVARARFVLEVTVAVADEVGAGRVGIRISPAHNIQDVAETDAADVAATYQALVDGLAPLGLAYLSVLHSDPRSQPIRELTTRFGGPIMLNTGFGTVTTRQEAQQLVDHGLADVVAVGRPAIANPDLVERWAGDHPENEPDASTFYRGGAVGYTDYPRLTA